MTKIEELKALNQKDEEKIKALQKKIQNRNEKINTLICSEYLGMLNELNLDHEAAKEFLISLKEQKVD
ncbi:conserved domain protein [Turicibacter sanguinis PC909]|uniref:Conserved domain protein n=1 Tax=Turicibacter sanguinis PC909 TaxID=702450 RepID=A0ABM9ZYX9_9FIRM|nr:hypothetical protein [Turicibacter sanguinis]EFF62537.1 conserved domain protein [Turicibacter sanguinis PC909]